MVTSNTNITETLLHVCAVTEMSLGKNMQTYATRYRMLCCDDAGFLMPLFFRIEKISSTVAFSLIM